MNRTKSILYPIFLLICCLLTSCFQPETGCLDIEASNFELSADEPCGTDDNSGSCPCTYPNISIGILDQDFAKQNFVRGDIYQVEGGYIRIKSLKFYLSEFRFIRSDGEYIGVEDTITLTTFADESALFKDDFLLISQQTNASIGMIKQSAIYDSIRFLVGISPAANTADPTTIRSSNHPLADDDMHFGTQDEGYIFNRIVLTKDTITDLRDTIPTEDIIFEIGGNDKLVEIKLPVSYKNTSGKSFSVGTLRIDHAKWFDGINFAADLDALMREETISTIVLNTAKVFSFSN